jgi:PAS domain S-box-containing protein
MNGPIQAASGVLDDLQRFQILVTGVSDYAIYLLNPDGYVKSWNIGAQRLKGYTPDEIIGQHFSVFYTPEDRDSGLPARALQTALREGKLESEGWRVRKDGTRFWASVVIDPIHDDAGRLIGFAKVTRDITERKAAQEALRESEERFRLLVQGVTDYALYMLSPAGEITNWNFGAQRIKGYAEAEVVGTNFSRFYTDEDRASGLPAQALATAAREGRFEKEGWRVRKDGTRFWAHVIIDAIYNDHGELVGFAKITRDITEKKEAAEALERANAALFQSQKMEALGQLTGGIAHDFNNLLAVLTNSLDVLSTRLKDPRDMKMLESMQRAVSRGASLTQQLLSFARQQPLSVERQDLNKLIGGFEAVLRRAGDASIEFDISLRSPLRKVLIDPARFEAALLNLVVNARDAMPDGGRITIATSDAELRDHQIGGLKAGSYVRTSVSDTGTGMPAEIIARAFEPFFTTKEIGKGTGLGLSQVYGFITQSGGEVVLRSEVGKGTTVDIYLPAILDDDKETDQEDKAEAHSDTVLIVEDEADLMDTASELFRSIGFEVLTAGNGHDAIDILKRKSNIDVLFTDVMMPNGMSGIELAHFTREHYPAIKIILASGYPLPAIKAAHGGLDDFTFMSKPYRLPELAKKLRMMAG